jgi:hypothetical protein
MFVIIASLPDVSWFRAASLIRGMLFGEQAEGESPI